MDPARADVEQPRLRALALGLRLLVAAAVIAALTSDAVRAWRQGLLAQDLSYFTNQSTAMAVALAVGMAWTAARPRRLGDVRGAVAFYLVMTGLVYALVVAPLSELGRWDIGWQGIVLHRLAPLAALADWLLTPRRGAPPRRRVLWWLVYPVLYLLCAWVRGAITGWYPYAFLDPTIDGWGTAVVTVLVVLAAFLVVAVLMHLVGGRLARTTTAGPRGGGRRRAAPAPHGAR